jgi:menaquinol-cytochrome c reductase iron-sulfur subunit
MTNCNNNPKVLPDWKRVFVSREEFLKVIGLAAGGLIVATLAIPSIMFSANFLMLPSRRRWISVGSTDDFKDGETVDVKFEDPYSLAWDGVSGRRSAWLRRTGDAFMAFAINCTHLGCPIRWEAGAKLFMCPCHGGVFYSNGDVAAGPPPRPLHQYPVRVVDGKVQIQVGAVLTEGS